jgi:hypothetical protein
MPNVSLSSTIKPAGVTAPHTQKIMPTSPK